MYLFKERVYAYLNFMSWTICVGYINEYQCLSPTTYPLINNENHLYLFISAPFSLLKTDNACITTGVTRPRGYKTFPCSTQLSTKFILLINVKMPTIVGILTFISMINTTSEWLKARHFLICWYLVKFRAQLS